MNTYKVMKEQHQQEVNNFPMFFAFSKEQFEEGMKKFGIEVTETDKICSIGYGGYIRKTDKQALKDMSKRHNEEMKKAMEDDQFIFDMFDYELSNHEYTYTYDVSDTIAALGLTADEINNNSKLLNGLQKACKAQKEWYALHG